MIRFELDAGSRFEVDAGVIRCLDEPSDMAMVNAAIDGRRFGPDEPGDPDRNLAQAVIDFWGFGQILAGDDPEPEVDGRVY